MRTPSNTMLFESLRSCGAPQRALKGGPHTPRTGEQNQKCRRTFAAPARGPKACILATHKLNRVVNCCASSARHTDISETLSTLTAGAIVTRMGRDRQSRAWSSAAR